MDGEKPQTMEHKHKAAMVETQTIRSFRQGEHILKKATQKKNKQTNKQKNHFGPLGKKQTSVRNQFCGCGCCWSSCSLRRMASWSSASRFLFRCSAINVFTSLADVPAALLLLLLPVEEEDVAAEGRAAAPGWLCSLPRPVPVLLLLVEPGPAAKAAGAFAAEWLLGTGTGVGGAEKEEKSGTAAAADAVVAAAGAAVGAAAARPGNRRPAAARAASDPVSTSCRCGFVAPPPRRALSPAAVAAAAAAPAAAPLLAEDDMRGEAADLDLAALAAALDAGDAEMGRPAAAVPGGGGGGARGRGRGRNAGSR